MAGYRFTDDRLTTDLPPRPVNAYGASKLFGERAGAALWRYEGISFVALRIGYCQRAEGNRPGPHMKHGLWGQQMWLSDRDLCQGFERAVLAQNLGYAVLNLMSDNSGMRWDLDATRQAIGYAPQDASVPVVTEETPRADRLARSEASDNGASSRPSPAPPRME
jgi:nucleoside-diphosphate-sugar epimerase